MQLIAMITTLIILFLFFFLSTAATYSSVTTFPVTTFYQLQCSEHGPQGTWSFLNPNKEETAGAKRDGQSARGQHAHCKLLPFTK